MTKQYVPTLAFYKNEGFNQSLNYEKTEDFGSHYGPETGLKVWQCNCGCVGFYLTPDGTHCWDCKKEQIF